jgi:quinol monooxygenase YgiN
MAANHQGFLTEPGCRCFDVLVDRADAELAYLYQVYDDGAAFAAHKQTAHYAARNAAVAPPLAQPRSAVRLDRHWPTVV